MVMSVVMVRMVGATAIVVSVVVLVTVSVAVDYHTFNDLKGLKVRWGQPT